MAPTKAAQARAAGKNCKRRRAWEQKIKFLKVMATKMGIDDYSQLFQRGSVCGHTYKSVHKETWKKLTQAEREEFGAFDDPAKIRRFVNNTKFLFSPWNKRRLINLHKKQWLFMQLSSLGFNFLPEQHRDVQAMQQMESKHLKA